MTIRGKPAVLPEESLGNMNETPITRKLQSVKECKNNINNRKIHEYVCSLKDCPHKKTKNQAVPPNLGAVALQKKDTKNKAQLFTCRIIGEIKSQDGIIQEPKIKLGNECIVERQAQLICSLEIVSTKEDKENSKRNKLNDERETIITKLRPARNAKSIANCKIRVIVENKHVE